METYQIIIIAIAVIWALGIYFLCRVVHNGQRTWQAEHKAEMESNRADHL